MSAKSAVVRDIVIMAVLFVGPLAVIIAGGWTVMTLGSDDGSTQEQPSEAQTDLPAAADPDVAEPSGQGGLGFATRVTEPAPAEHGSLAGTSADADSEPGSDTEEHPDSLAGANAEPGPTDSAAADAPLPDRDDTAAAPDVGEAASAAADIGLPFVERLKKRDILSGVKAGAASLAPCMQQARDSELLRKGKHRLTVDFVIRPGGTVGGAKLRKPKRLRDTFVSACVTRAIEEWRFPPSNDGAPVKNFPIPFTVQ